MADQLIGRRTALKYFGMLATLPAAQEFLKKWLAKASATSNPPSGHGLHAVLAAGSDASSSYVPQFFKPHEFETRSEEHTSELQSRLHLVCRLLLEKTKEN